MIALDKEDSVKLRSLGLPLRRFLVPFSLGVSIKWNDLDRFIEECNRTIGRRTYWAREVDPVFKITVNGEGLGFGISEEDIQAMQEINSEDQDISDADPDSFRKDTYQNLERKIDTASSLETLKPILKRMIILEAYLARKASKLADKSKKGKKKVPPRPFNPPGTAHIP